MMSNYYDFYFSTMKRLVSRANDTGDKYNNLNMMVTVHLQTICGEEAALVRSDNKKQIDYVSLSQKVLALNDAIIDLDYEISGERTPTKSYKGKVLKLDNFRYGDDE